MGEELSMAQKVEKLGFNIEEFKKDMFDIDDKMTNKCLITLNYSGENLEKNIYPELRKFKEKYGINLPIGLCGVDLPRLDNRLNNLMREKGL